MEGYGMPPDDALPAWATEEVHLAPYDGMWPRSARAFKGEIDGALSPWLLRPVEHVGSTAVPGLLAKPVIDLMAMVGDPAAAGRQVQGRLQELGWEPVPPELDKRPWRLLFVKVAADGAHRLAHLHLLVDGARRWDEQLRFREALRGDDRLRDEYAALKRRLAKAFVADREGYTDAKAAFHPGGSPCPRRFSP